MSWSSSLTGVSRAGKKGFARSDTMTATVRVDRETSPAASEFGTYPSRRAAASTLRRVSSRTRGSPRRARETVDWETPAARATVQLVGAADPFEVSRAGECGSVRLGRAAVGAAGTGSLPSYAGDSAVTDDLRRPTARRGRQCSGGRTWTSPSRS